MSRVGYQLVAVGMVNNNHDHKRSDPQSQPKVNPQAITSNNSKSKQSSGFK